MTRRFSVLIAVFAVAPLLAQEPPSKVNEPIPPAAAARIAELEAMVERLAAILEGTAKPVNLARTELSAVTASSVNGSRPLDNVFYGIRNAFDDGRNKKNGLLYTYWLTSGEPSPWVEVRFDEPVSIESVFVEGGPSFYARFAYAKGGERNWPLADQQLRPDRLEHGVRAIKLIFRGGGNVRVDEIRIMGHAKSAASAPCTPRILDEPAPTPSKGGGRTDR